MSSLRSIAVFCGASMGRRPVHAEAAAELGEGIARAGMRLVYGGGGMGLMGVVANAALAAGGPVIGIIPDFLMAREVAHPSLAELVITDSMHSRKRRMFEMADAFVVLPGGLGTLDEAVEIITWRQLGLHDKPILLCDVEGSARPLAAAVAAAVQEGFAREADGRLFEITEGPTATLARLATLAAAPALPAGTSGRL